MKSIYIASLFLAASVFFSSAYASENGWRIHPHGFGPVKVGMTLKEASLALGDDLMATEEENIDCFHVKPQHKFKEMEFMVIGDRISRVSLFQPSTTIKTDRNIGIGDNESRIKSIYNKSLVIEPHQYGDENDHYLTYWVTSKRNFGVRYEVVAGRVEVIHGGNETIQYVEGCS